MVNYFFETEKNFNDFQSLSKGFKMCDSLDEIYEAIQEIFESKKFYIKKGQENNNIFLFLKISLLGGKIQEIQLELKKKESNTNEINVEVCNKVNALEKEIVEIKKENLLFKEKVNNDLAKINNLEEVILKQKNEIEKLKEWKEKYDKEIQKTIQKEKDKEALKKIDSKIIKEKKK